MANEQLLAREEGDERRDLLGLAEAPERDAGDHVVDVLLRELVEDRRLGSTAGAIELTRTPVPARSLPIDFVIPITAALRRRVGGGHRVPLLAGDRGDVDDAPVAAVLHPGDHRAVAEEDAVAVDGEDALPLGVGDVDRVQRVAADPGRADEDVEDGRGPTRPGRPRRPPAESGHVGGDVRARRSPSSRGRRFGAAAASRSTSATSAPPCASRAAPRRARSRSPPPVTSAPRPLKS